MDYGKILISCLLIIIFLILFGYESVTKLRQGGISISRYEKEPSTIKPPGKSESEK